jgi:ankyrin repeat protein
MGSASAAIVLELMAHGADVNSSSEDGYSPLGMAANRGSFEAVRLLLEHGAEVNIQDNAGQTPLMLAEPGHLEIIRLLIERGSNLQLKNREGRNAYEEALWQADSFAAMGAWHDQRVNDERKKAALILAHMQGSR